MGDQDIERSASAPHRVPRRALLAAAGGGLGSALAGCVGDGGQRPDPVTLTANHQCDVCGMVIVNHPGPNAELFYQDRRPSGHENPARFCSTWEAFQYDFERRDRGWARQAFYVTDYSAVAYDITTDAGDRVISSHPDAAAFGDGEAVTFVAGSEVLGSMGADMIGFSDAAEARTFQNTYGGSVVAFDDVTRSVIAELGRA